MNLAFDICVLVIVVVGVIGWMEAYSLYQRNQELEKRLADAEHVEDRLSKYCAEQIQKSWDKAVNNLKT